MKCVIDIEFRVSYESRWLRLFMAKLMKVLPWAQGIHRKYYLIIFIDFIAHVLSVYLNVVALLKLLAMPCPRSAEQVHHPSDPSP